MAKVLIVDDSPVDRQLVGHLLEKRSGLSGLDHSTGLVPLFACGGLEALEVIELESPEVVLTDLQMPEMNGLELVLEIRKRYPTIPVILMTAHGSEDIAVRALQGGAASYVPKRNLAHDLLETVESVIEAAQAKRRHHRLMECLIETKAHFVLDNDPALIPPLVGHLKDGLALMTGADDTTLFRVSIALREAVLNAMEHGNLELDSALRESDESEYHRLGAERRKQEPYRKRRVCVIAHESPIEATYIISDEGRGFDPTKRPDPRDPSNLDHVSGRGLLLIQTFMTEVRHNARGNEITMTWRPGANCTTLKH